jgi:hypothetical protein
VPRLVFHRFIRREAPRGDASPSSGGLFLRSTRAAGVGACACSPITFGSPDAAGARRPALSPSRTKTASPLSHTIPWGASSCGERPAWASESPAVCAPCWHADGREFVAADMRCYVRRSGVRGVSGPRTPRPTTSALPILQRGRASGAHLRSASRQAASVGRAAGAAADRPGCSASLTAPGRTPPPRSPVAPRSAGRSTPAPS